MIIPNEEKTPTPPYIMHSSMDFYNMSIIVDSLISLLLITAKTPNLKCYQLGRSRKYKGYTIINNNFELPVSRGHDLQPSMNYILNSLGAQSALALLFLR